MAGFAASSTWLRVLKQTASDWLDDKAMRLSAALALYAILSLAPLLVISVKAVGLIWRDRQNAQSQVMAQMTNLMGEKSAQGIQPLLNNTAKPGSGILATVISSIVLIFSATGVFVELQDSMNTIWHAPPRKGSGIWNFIRQRLLSIAMVLGVAFLLLVSMFVSTLLTTFAKGIAGDSKWMLLAVDLIVSYVVVSLLFAAIFKFLPDVKVQWADVWHAALITGILFTLGKYGLAVYFKRAAPTTAFGAAGSLVAVLLWVYYSAFILFFGAELSKVWASTRPHQAAQPSGPSATNFDIGMR